MPGLGEPLLDEPRRARVPGDLAVAIEAEQRLREAVAHQQAGRLRVEQEVGASVAGGPADSPRRPALERGPHALRRAQQPHVAEPAVRAGERLHARRLRHPGDPARPSAAPRKQVLEREEALAPDAEPQQLVGEHADALVRPPAFQQGVERAEAAERLQLPARSVVELPHDIACRSRRVPRSQGCGACRSTNQSRLWRSVSNAGRARARSSRARGQRSGVGDHAGEVAALIAPQPPHRAARRAPVALPACHLGVGVEGGEARERAVDGLARLGGSGRRGEGTRRNGEQQQGEEAAHGCVNPATRRGRCTDRQPRDTAERAR